MSPRPAAVARRALIVRERRGYTDFQLFSTRTLDEKVGPGPPFISAELGRLEPEDRSMRDLQRTQETIETRLAELEPDVEVIALERPAAETLRVYIDRPAGVDLGLCERVTNHLRDLLESYSLEVSSPGLDRPLTKPEHFRRFVGRKVRVRTRDAIEGRRSFTGTLTAADERSVCVNSGEDEVAIPLDEVRRSNLVPDLSEVSP